MRGWVDGSSFMIRGRIQGWCYLEAALGDYTTEQWGCRGQFISGAGTAIGTGKANTQLIANYHNNTANFDGNDYRLYSGDFSELGCHALNNGEVAARRALQYTSNGYNDWFLPSRDELNELYLQKDMVGNFTSANYWTSSEINADVVHYQHMGTGLQDNYYKSSDRPIRLIRAF